MTISGNPCADCGLCCSSYRVSFSWIETSGFKEKSVPLELVEKVSEQLVCMKGTKEGNGPCVAQKEGGCSIYDRRPSVCRDFEVWESNGSVSERCQGLRVKAGLEPLPRLEIFKRKYALKEISSDYAKGTEMEDKD